MHRAAIVAGFIAIVLSARAGWSQQLIPFTPVSSVCPTCTTGPKYDRIVLRDGSDAKARVIAENERFYVLEKFGELRAVGRDQVRTVEKNPAVERPSGLPDQILFRDGIVLAGTLKSAKDDAEPFEMVEPISGTTVLGYRAAISLVYRAGKLLYAAPRQSVVGTAKRRRPTANGRRPIG
jgi:hypothetical protein